MLICLSQVVSDMRLFFKLTVIVSGLFSSHGLIHKMMLSLQLAYFLIVIIVLIETTT